MVDVIVEKDQETYKANAAREEKLNAFDQKKLLCWFHRKMKCGECDGKDEYGTHCVWWEYLRRKEVVIK